MVSANISAFALLAGLVMVTAQNTGAFDATMMHPRALATSSSQTYCESESLACQADSICLECYQDVYAEEVGLCMDISNCALSSPLTQEDWLSCTDFCENNEDIVSCAVEARDDCGSSSLLKDFVGCGNEAICTGDVGTDTSGGATAPTSTNDDVTSGSATTDYQCIAELQDCYGDASCVACTQVYSNQYLGCLEEVIEDASERCDFIDSLLCCSIASEDDCGNNSGFNAYMDCVYTATASDCSVDLSTCSSSSSSSEATTPTTTDEETESISDPETTTTDSSTSNPTATDSSIGSDRGVSVSSSTTPTTAEDGGDTSGEATDTDTSSASRSAAPTMAAGASVAGAVATLPFLAAFASVLKL